MKLGYLGPNTNSEIAAREYAIGVAGLEMITYPTMGQVFKALDSDDFGKVIIPVRNSITGDIAYKKIAEQKKYLKIDEISIKIRHCLAAKSKNLRAIISHTEVLRQCADYLDAKYPYHPRISIESTNEAAKVASIGYGIGAIANIETCLIHGLKVIDGNIIKSNFSTFWILMKKS